MHREHEKKDEKNSRGNDLLNGTTLTIQTSFIDTCILIHGSGKIKHFREVNDVIKTHKSGWCGLHQDWISSMSSGCKIIFHLYLW